MNDRIYLSPPDVTGREFEYVRDTFESNWLAPVGPNLDRFEAMLCDVTCRKAAVAVSSGTAAIHLALIELGVTRGDVVFCSDLTFAGSCNPIVYQGAEPIFIDSEPQSWNMSAIALEKAFQWAKTNNKMPKAVIIVNLYGQSADMDSLLPICSAYNVPVIEDAAESLGAKYMDRPSGSFGDFSVISFNGNKIISTSSGGVLLSDKTAAIDKSRFRATQARERERHYEHKEIGYNYRLSNILAALGVGQLEQLTEKVARRKQIFARYQVAFSDCLPLSMMPVPSWSKPNYWLSTFTLNPDAGRTPTEILERMDTQNIEARPIWKPMHQQPIFKEAHFFAHADSGSVGADLFARGVCLPSGSSLTDEQQERVIQTVFSAL